MSTSIATSSTPTASGTHHFGGGNGTGNFGSHGKPGLSSGVLTAILFIAGAVVGILVGAVIYFVVRRIRRDRERKLERLSGAAPTPPGFAPPTPPPKLPAKDVYGSRLATVGWNDPPPRMTEVRQTRGRLMSQDATASASESSRFLRGMHKTQSSTSSLDTDVSKISTDVSNAPLLGSARPPRRPIRPVSPGLVGLSDGPQTADLRFRNNVTFPRQPDISVTTVQSGSLSAPLSRSQFPPGDPGYLSPYRASSIAPDRSSTSAWYSSTETLSETKHQSGGQNSITSMAAKDWPMPPPPMPPSFPPPPPPTNTQPPSQASRPRSSSISKSKRQPSQDSMAPPGYI